MTSFRPTGAAAILGLCIALGPATAGYFVYKGILEAKQSDRYVTAKGLVERVEKADRGVCVIGFKRAGKNLTEIYQKLSQDSDVIKNFFIKEGFDPTEISISDPRVVDLYTREWGGNPPPSSERYTIEEGVVVNSKKVDALNKIPSLTGQFVNQGISLTRSEISFYLDKFNSLRPLLIAEATKNAQEGAAGFAKTTGSQLGGIRRANQGTITMTSPNASPNQEYDEGIGSLMKKIRVVSTIEFYLQ